MFQDDARVEYQQAMVIQKVRDDFFNAVRSMLLDRVLSDASGQPPAEIDVG
jgi:hypothetical protein